MWRVAKEKLTLAVVCCLVVSSLSCGAGNRTSLDAEVPDPPAVPPPPPKFLSDGFESGDFSKWSLVWNPADVTINNSTSFVRSGAYSAQFRYSLCSSCGNAHQDTNRFVELAFNAGHGYPNGIDHVFVRGSVYFKTPEVGGSVEIQRKLYYIKIPSGASGVPNAYWAVILSSDGLVSTPNKVQLYLLLANSALGGATTRIWTAASPAEQLEFDRWHDIQIEVKANTPAIHDGRVALWLNGVKVFEESGLDVRRDSDLGVDRIEIGCQADRLDYVPVEEYRYWDDVRVSDSFIQ
ncbi:MAG: heparin lyase I family protein [bacterium]